MRAVENQKLEGYELRGFSFLDLVGSGAFAQVYQVHNKADNSRVAIKAIPMAHLKNSYIKKLVESQITIMRSCTDNPNIIKFIDTFCTEKSILIVMEFCKDGSLEAYIKKMKRLTEDKATHFLKQMINGFKGLHEKNIIHRDFKAENVLLRAGELKIADFGFAKMLTGENSVTNTYVGTPLTMAPEVYAGTDYGMKADLWSLGIVYYQMIFGRCPYEGKSEQQINKASRHPPQFNGVILSDNAKDFILKCLTYDQKTRISWKQLYKHPLITGEQKAKYGLKSTFRNIEQNKQFYSKNEQSPIRGHFFNIQPLEFTIAKQQKLTTIQLHKFKLKNERIKDIEAAIQKYEERYLNQRNNHFFIFKHIVPYVHILAELPVNHSNFMFLLCKNTLHDLRKVQERIKGRENVFKGEFFKEFVKSQSYGALLEEAEDDSTLARIQMDLCREHIKNPSSELVLEMKHEEIVHKEWEKYLKETVEEYEHSLMPCLHQTKDNVKNKLILVIEALSHFKHHREEDNFEIFDHLIAQLNIQDAEYGINSRMEYWLSQFAG